MFCSGDLLLRGFFTLGAFYFGDLLWEEFVTWGFFYFEGVFTSGVFYFGSFLLWKFPVFLSQSKIPMSQQGEDKFSRRRISEPELQIQKLDT